MIRANLLCAAVLILFGGWYLWRTTAAADRRLPYDPGTMFVPRMLAIGLILLSALLLLQQIVARLPHPKEAPPEPLDSRQWLQTFGLLVTTVAYALLLPWLGFLLVTPIYLIAAMFLCGARSRLHAGVTAAVVTGVIYVSFAYFFRVSLPAIDWP
jgi:hypothetical protein